MARIATTVNGLARLEGDAALLLDTPYPDVGAALEAGETLADLASAPVLGEEPLAGVALLAPVVRPPDVWIVGLAYHAHRDEVGTTEPEGEPTMLPVTSTSVCGPHDPVRLPRVAPDQVDYEGELVVVIGHEARDVPEADAWSVVAGLTVGDDVSARDVQKGRRPGWLPNVGAAKSFDTFKPVGPAIVSVDEVPDPDDLLLRTWVDGELRQEVRTSQLIWPVPYLVSFLSRITTLRPGTLLCTGTPGGVGHPSGRSLVPGSVVRVEVDGVGAIENTFVEA